MKKNNLKRRYGRKMSMIRTPPIKLKQTRMRTARTALRSVNAPTAQDMPPAVKSNTVRGAGIFGNETESEESDYSGKQADSLNKKSDQHPGTKSGHAMTHLNMANVIDIARKPCSICICFTKWIPVVFILSVVGWSYYAYVIELCIFTVASYAEKAVYLILYHVLLLLFLWSYYQTVMTPIARVPKQFRLSAADQEQFDGTEDRRQQGQILERHAMLHHLPVHNRTMTGGAVRYCEKCRQIKPDRCHHCSVCSECVLKMDHHCPWVNNCIGFSNYKFFVLFLGYAFAYCVFIALTSLQYFIGFWRDGLEGMARFHILFLFFVSTMFGISLISLFSYHCYLVIRNQSTLETFRPPVFASGPDKRGFSMTRFANFCEVFGDAKLKWFLPVFTSLGDGVAFPMRHQPLTSVSYGTTSDATAAPVTSLGNGGGSPGQASPGRRGPPRWQGEGSGFAQKYTNRVQDEPEARSDVRLIVE